MNGLQNDDVTEFDCQTLIFYVNGQRVEVTDVDPKITLAAFLRNTMRLTGTKIGCNEGGCGACTVMISEYIPDADIIRHIAVNACLMPICAVFGKAVTTVEGVGSTAKLHPVQERLAAGHGTQCGFCTPGFIVAMYALLRNNPSPTKEDVDEAIQGNLCRCTGYRPILEAFYSFTDDYKPIIKGTDCCLMGDQCCKINETKNCESDRRMICGLTDYRKFRKFDATMQDLIFPPELKMDRYYDKSLQFVYKDTYWLKPKTLSQFLRLKQIYPNAKIIGGNTEVGIESKQRFLEFQLFIYPKQIRELRQIRIDESKGIFIGAALSLSETRTTLMNIIKKEPEEKCSVFKTVVEMLYWFANKQIRNVATVAGNLVTASPISDLNPIWLCCGASVTLISSNGNTRIVPIDQSFFVGYRKTVVQNDETVLGIWIPFSKKNQFVRAYKQAQRRDDDITIVTGAFSVQLNTNHIVEDAKIAYGGMASVTKMAAKTGVSMLNKKWNKKLLDETLDQLQQEFQLGAGIPGGMERYRQALTKSFFLKYFFDVCRDAKISFCSSITSAPSLFELQDGFTASQFYQEVPSDQPLIDPLGRPFMHQSAIKHTTGEAVFCQDICPAGTLWAAFVTSPISCGYLKSVDIREAVLIPGFQAYFDYKDLPESAFLNREVPVFVKDKISYHSQPIGLIVADNHESARKAASVVKVNYVAETPIISIEDAIKANSYLNEKPYVLHSKLAKNYGEKFLGGFEKCDLLVEGEIKIGGQEHFYLETHNAIAIPCEGDELKVIASTQGCDWLQKEICKFLGVPQHKVCVKTRRIGGGFGGKESASLIFALPVVLAAKKLNRAVKMDVERNEDMAITGNRHPFKGIYKVGVSKNGKLQNLRLDMFANAGHSTDLSIGVIYRAITHSDNVYRWPNSDVSGLLCKTNIASNTAFRGFGAPQSMFITETIIKHIAEEYEFDVNQFREQNFYNENDCTPSGSVLVCCNVRRCWADCKVLSDYTNREKQIHEFNRLNKYVKRGIYMSPTKFGAAFSPQFLNQGGALVNVYVDGSVLISVGGVEMGQGLYTKLIQVAARCLGIDAKKVHINEASTDNVPNASPTAASVSSDLYGFAVKDACETLMKRLLPIINANPDGKWEDWLKEAYLAQISLSATGFGVLKTNTIDFENGIGNGPYSYYVYGVSCAEVEIDCMTGAHMLRRVDIVMDVGESLNPAIDIGQIEGAFIQGYGLFTMEELKVFSDGRRLTRGPSTYKIPSAADTPPQFNVKLLKGSSNSSGIFSAKAVGEPPLFLGVSAFFAIREAIRSFRIDHGKTGYFRFDSPATPERIRLAFEDVIVDQVSHLPKDGSYTPWTVEL